LPLFEKQIAALSFLEDDVTNEVGYGGAARGGKSVLGCFWQILRRLSMPDSYGLISRNEYSKLRDTTIISFFEVLNKLGLKKDVDYKASGIPLTVEFKNLSRIFFREIKYYPSDPEFDRLGSYDLTDAFLDEAQQIHWKARNILKGRFSVTNKNGWKTIPKTLYTFNPSKNWVYNEFYKPYNEKNLDRNKQFIPALPSDNPYVPESFFQNLKTADEVTKQRLLYGNFEYDDDPSALCDHDAILDLFTNNHLEGGVRRLSADLAMQGRDRFVTMYQNGAVIKVIIDKKKSTGKDIEESLTSAKKEYQVSNTNIVADSDGLGSYLNSYLKNIRTFHGGSNKMKLKYKKLYTNLKTACAYKLAEKVNNRELYIVCSKEHEEIIKKEISICLKRDNIDSDKIKLMAKDKMREMLGHSPDFLDSLIMLQYWDVIGISTSPII